jgi:hypothetical protein
MPVEYQRALGISAGQKRVSAVHAPKIRNTLLVGSGILTISLLVGATVLAIHWPFSQARVTQYLQEGFPASVTFQTFHSTIFPHPGCVGEGVVFRRLGSPPSTPPIVTIQRLAVEANYIDLFVRPSFLARVVTNGFSVHVPPLGTPTAPSGWQGSKSTSSIGEIVADGASVEIARADNKTPLVFEIHTLKLTSVSRNKAMSYDLAVRNPLPPGEIHAQGKFGPWNSSDPGETPVQGHYLFQNADLSIFNGIAGILSSEDEFHGILGHIESQGRIDIPDFQVVRSKHSVHITANYHASIDGTNGDVQLERVTAAFLNTHILASGPIASVSGQDGKTAAIDLNVQDGRIEDVLRLFVSGPKPSLNGITSFRAHVVLPAGERPFVQKLRVVGDFGIEGGEFAKTSTQENMDTLSDRSRGEKANSTVDDAEPERVVSNVSGHVELRNAIATFSNASFNVPGAFAQMHGTYGLQSEAVDLHGTLKTQADLSQMNSGIKSVLLKPFNGIFKRKQAGAVVPIYLIGTYQHPQAGVDLP